MRKLLHNYLVHIDKKYSLSLREISYNKDGVDITPLQIPYDA